MTRFHLRTTAGLCALLLALGCASHTPVPDRSTGSESAADPRLDWWREARFGMFIHWGLYSIPAGEWNDGTGHAEWIRTTAQIPLSTYDRFVPQFDPVRFDADAWVRAAIAAGMRYLVITSKHHDGFCLFDSEQTDFDVMATPFRRDILRELTDACRRHALRIGWYHSIMDWHHPDYLPRRGWETDRSEEGADFERFTEYLHAQVTELLTNYGPIDVMWFDGEWERTWNHERGRALYELCRTLQPGAIINNRVDVGRGGMAGLTAEGEYCGDFGTPEQEVPATGFPGVDWESCITMNRHWGYNRADHDYKSTRELIRLLVDVASKGGNLLLNIGPKADGTFPEESLERLQGIGTWMATNGEAVHGTVASPFPAAPWGRCTMRRVGDRTRLYLHVFEWPKHASSGLLIPGVGNRDLRAWLLTDPEGSLRTVRGTGTVAIEVPEDAPDPDCTVVVLEVEGDPIVYSLPVIEAASDILLGSLEVTIAGGSDALEVRYTTDGSDPVGSSLLAGHAIIVTDSTTIRARSFHEGKPVTEVAERRFTRVEPRQARDPGATSPGLRRSIYAGSWDRLPGFEGSTPIGTEIVSGIDLAGGAGAELRGARYEGWITVPEDAVFEFVLESDDGSRLSIGDAVTIDNDGLHSPFAKAGQVPLAAGSHRFVVEYFNKTGGAVLSVKVAVIGEERVAIPASWLSH